VMSLHERTIQEGSWFYETLPVQLVGALTIGIVSRRTVSQQQLDTEFNDFHNGLERLLRRPIGYLKAVETTPQRHLHVALIDTKPIDVYDVHLCWARAIGDNSPKRSMVWTRATARVADMGLSYLLKGDDVEFSDNINLFLPGRDTRSMRSKELRAYEKIYPTSMIQ
jgi:hypothetical protein